MDRRKFLVLAATIAGCAGPIGGSEKLKISIRNSLDKPISVSVRIYLDGEKIFNQEYDVDASTVVNDTTSRESFFGGSHQLRIEATNQVNGETYSASNSWFLNGEECENSISIEVTPEGKRPVPNKSCTA